MPCSKLSKVVAGTILAVPPGGGSAGGLGPIMIIKEDKESPARGAAAGFRPPHWARRATHSVGPRAARARATVPTPWLEPPLTTRQSLLRSSVVCWRGHHDECHACHDDHHVCMVHLLGCTEVACRTMRKGCVPGAMCIGRQLGAASMQQAGADWKLFIAYLRNLL